MTMSAAPISSGVPDSEDWNACALPWKEVASDAGLPACFSNCWIAATASPERHARASELNEIVTDGNRPW